MKIQDILEFNTEEIKVGDFVFIEHPYSWDKAYQYGVLSPWELTNDGILRGQVIGTYGPWDHVPGSKFHWDIVPDVWISSKYHVMKVLDTYSKTKDFSNYAADGFDPEKYKTYVQSVIPSLSVGSCQLDMDKVVKDIQRSRNFNIMLTTGDFSELEKCLPNEMVIEKEIIGNSIKEFERKQFKIPGVVPGSTMYYPTNPV